MDSLLLLAGIMGFGAVMIAIHVFSRGGSGYDFDPGDARLEISRKLRDRIPGDRRCGLPVEFPLLVNGLLVPHERRALPDRRRKAA